MTERHKILTDTKKLLRSVLNTCKDGCQMENLDREYRRMVGGPIPFMKLGHHSLEDFLESARDTVLIESNEKGAKIVKVKLDKDIAHINKFIQQQKGFDHHIRKPQANQGGRNRFSTSHRNFSGSKMPPYDVQSKIVSLVKETQVLIVDIKFSFQLKCINLFP